MTTAASRPIETRMEAEAFARRWVEEWNARDVEAILAHFADAVRFTSPRAAARVGTATVEGKQALREYWGASMVLITSLRFTLDHVLWDAEARGLAIVYDAEINDQRTRACEMLGFDASGLAVRGEAMYGAAV